MGRTSKYYYFSLCVVVSGNRDNTYDVRRTPAGSIEMRQQHADDTAWGQKLLCVHGTIRRGEGKSLSKHQPGNIIYGWLYIDARCPQAVKPRGTQTSSPKASPRHPPPQALAARGHALVRQTCG